MTKFHLRHRKTFSFFLVFLSTLSATHVPAQEGSSIGVFAKTRQDIDYRLNTLGFSASVITPAGLFHCKPGVLRGETRIDSFNNIFGIGDVRKAEWKRFTARDLECRYGAKWNAAGGTFKAGFGFRDYQGRTADEPGGKDIRIQGAGALLGYDGKDFDAKLNWQREIHDYTLRNRASIGNYDSLVDATEDTYVASSTFKRLYSHARHVSGNKDNVYTTPFFPPNRFRYAHTDVALGMTFAPERNGLTLIAPIFGGGSYRGSFNPLRGETGLKGIKLAGILEAFEIDLDIVRHKGEGSRPYLPATNRLTEQKTTTTISLGIKKNDWRVGLQNIKSDHSANATIVSPIYALILGGYGPFNNKRAEDKWSLSAAFPVAKKVTAEVSLYYADRHDRQYNHPEHDYNEKGGFVLLKYTE